MNPSTRVPGRRAFLVLAAALLGLSLLAPPAWAAPGDEEADEQETLSARANEPAPVGRRANARENGQRSNTPEATGNGIPGDGRGSMSPGGFSPSASSGREANRAASAGDTSFLGWLVRGGLALLALPLAAWVFFLPRRVNRIASPGFEVITPSEPRQFIPLEEKTAQLDFIARVKTGGGLRLSANLNKVMLSNRRSGYLLEDKNFRNALLVNRRRVRRTMLRDGDVLDLGDLTLLYRDNRNGVRHPVPSTPPEGKVQVRFERLRGPARRGTPALVYAGPGSRTFHITKNLVFIGRSESNDLVVKSHDVQNRHAKIERVGSRYKLQDLTLLGGTYVNNRRIEQRYLREGDEIAIEKHRFTFTLAPKAPVERPAPQDAIPDEPLAEGEETLAGEEAAPMEADAERTNA